MSYWCQKPQINVCGGQIFGGRTDIRIIVVDDSGTGNPALSSPLFSETLCSGRLVFGSLTFRLSGDLIYLDVVTLEENKFCITGTIERFYVNSSTDPRPKQNASEATTLVALLQNISSKFKKAFRDILERKPSAHPFENVQSLLPPNTWLGLYPLPGMSIKTYSSVLLLIWNLSNFSKGRLQKGSLTGGYRLITEFS